MEFYQLEQFVAIAESHTMREAAEKLLITQPALSKSIKKLERELGCRLFDRTHNRLYLSSFGAILFKSAQEIIAIVNSTKSQIDIEKNRISEIIKLGFSYSMFCQYETPEIAKLLGDLFIESYVADEDALLERLQDGRIDFAYSDERYATGEFKSVDIFTEEAYLSVGNQSQLAGKESIGIDEIASESLLLPKSSPGLTYWYKEIASASGIDEHDIVFSEMQSYLREMDESPMNHFTTSLMTKFSGENGDRSAIRIDDPIATRKFVRLSRKQQEPRLEEVEKILDQRCSRILVGHEHLIYLYFPQVKRNFEIKNPLFIDQT